MGDGSESTIICVDNSDYNINEDLYPDRLVSLKECLNIICENKILSLDHRVGVLLMAGERCRTLVALTNSLGKLLNSIHDIPVNGTCDIVKSLSIAQLALKHRFNRGTNQKIVLLLGSPCTENEQNLMNIAKQLKKNNIGIEIVNFGSTEINREILTKLYENVNNNQNSKYIEVPPDATNISESILSVFSNHAYCSYGDVNANSDIFNTVQNALREDDIGNAVGGMNNAVGVNRNATNAASRLNDMPTIEDVQNMVDIDNDLREALLLSLREYNERQQILTESSHVPESAPAATSEENGARENQTTDNTNVPPNTNTSETQNETIEENKETNEQSDIGSKEEKQIENTEENKQTEQNEQTEQNDKNEKNDQTEKNEKNEKNEQNESIGEE